MRNNCLAGNLKVPFSYRVGRFITVHVATLIMIRIVTAKPPTNNSKAELLSKRENVKKTVSRTVSM